MSSSRRGEERNAIRASVRALFRDRACFALVRPAVDEAAVRRAAELADDEPTTPGGPLDALADAELDLEFERLVHSASKW